MGPTNTLNYLLTHIAAVMTKQTDKVLHDQLGLGLSQYRILMVLEWNPRIRQSAIASSLGQTEASISRQINLLKTRGLLTSKPDTINKKVNITVPTPMGMQLTEAAVNVLRRTFGPEYAVLGENKLNQLIIGLQQLHSITCQPGKLGSCDHQLGL
jgi:DNA-binding MarR family transcriptional regulator